MIEHVTHLGPYELDRVHLGDCIELMKELPDECYVISDPPYNQKYHYGFYGDNLQDAQYYELLFKVFYDRKSVIIHYPEETINLMGGGNLGTCQECVSWVYNSNTGKQHRLITWWNCKPDFSKIPQPYKNPSDRRIAERIRNGESARAYDWWKIDQVKNVSKDANPHPCPAPLELMKQIIKATTSEFYTVLDPFSGSGTTGVAAIQTGRRFLGFEIDPRWVDLANKRIEAAKAQGVLNL